MPGASCSTTACLAGSGPTVVFNSRETTDGSDSTADLFTGSVANWGHILSGGIACDASRNGQLMAVLQGGPVDAIEGTVFICRSNAFQELWSQDYWGGWDNVSVSSLGSTVMGVASGFHNDASVIPSAFRPRAPISNTTGLTDWDEQPSINKSADYFWFATTVCGGAQGGTSPSPIRATGYFGGAGVWWMDALEGTADLYSPGSFHAGPVRHFLGACPATGYPAASSYNLYDICVAGFWPPAGTASCSVPAGRTFSWSNGDVEGNVRTCSGSVATTTTVPNGGLLTVSGTPAANRASFLCVNGNVVIWPTWNNCM